MPCRNTYRAPLGKNRRVAHISALAVTHSRAMVTATAPANQ